MSAVENREAFEFSDFDTTDSAYDDVRLLGDFALRSRMLLSNTFLSHWTLAVAMYHPSCSCIESSMLILSSSSMYK